MRVIEYHHSNFEDVLNTLNDSRWAYKESDNSGSEPERIVFNKTRKRFEHYEAGEKTSSRTDEYSHVNEAIEEYLNKQNNDNATTVSEEPVMRVGENVTDADFTELDQEVPSIFVEDPSFPEIDDAELLEATNSNLAVIRELKDKTNAEAREKLMQVIANIYNYDMVSESDIAQSIVETSELKKLLSMLFSKLGIEVSSTRVSHDLKVTSGLLKFIPKIEYGLDDYRRGASQCYATMSTLAEAKEQLDDKDRRIAELTRELGIERRSATESTTELTKLKNDKAEAKKLKSLTPMEHVIVYETDKGPRYLYITKEKFAEDGSTPTKYLASTSRIEKARRYTLEQAKVQINRMVRHNENVPFVDLKGKGSKELSAFFSIYASAVVKIENES